MNREVDMQAISDGRLYSANDMVRADCQGCAGCHTCCTGMGSSILLDPYDIHRIRSYFRIPFEALMANHIDLRVVDGMILPNLRMTGEDEHCIFLNGEGRCGIHKIRPGFCRLFPLGRIYEGRSFHYFLQTEECPHPDRQKIKVKKWIDEADVRRYEQFVKDWHYFLKDAAAALAAEAASDETVRNVNIYVLKQFYMRGFEDGRDFYMQFGERLAETKAALGMD